jgi:hypothetical protein
MLEALKSVFVSVALAATADQPDVLTKIKTEIIVPVIEFLFVAALVFFLWGVVQYILNLNTPADRQTGQRHMFWGIIGLAIMLGAFGIINFVFNTVTNNGTTKGIGGEDIKKPDIIDQGTF